MIEAGPDAGRSMVLAAGRYLLGRGNATSVIDTLVAIDDPEIEAHHLIVDVHDTRGCKITQLSGRLPMMIDGHPASFANVGHGAILELGASRLVVGEPRPRAHGRHEFEVLAGAERAAYLARSLCPTMVTLGVGSIRLPIPIDIGQLPIEQQPAADAAESHIGLPILADLGGRDRVVVAIRGAGASSVANSIAAQIGRHRRTLIVTDLEGIDADPSAAATVLLTLPDGATIPAASHSLLDLGARWRATWTSDLDADVLPIRLHAAGLGSHLPEPAQTSRSGGRRVPVPGAESATSLLEVSAEASTEVFGERGTYPRPCRRAGRAMTTGRRSSRPVSVGVLWASPDGSSRSDGGVPPVCVPPVGRASASATAQPTVTPRSRGSPLHSSGVPVGQARSSDSR